MRTGGGVRHDSSIAMRVTNHPNRKADRRSSVDLADHIMVGQPRGEVDVSDPDRGEAVANVERQSRVACTRPDQCRAVGAAAVDAGLEQARAEALAAVRVDGRHAPALESPIAGTIGVWP